MRDVPTSQISLRSLRNVNSGGREGCAALKKEEEKPMAAKPNEPGVGHEPAGDGSEAQ